MKTIDIYSEDNLVRTFVVSDNYFLLNQGNYIDLKDNGELLAIIPNNYLIIIDIKQVIKAGDVIGALSNKLDRNRI